MEIINTKRQTTWSASWPYNECYLSLLNCIWWQNWQAWFFEWCLCIWYIKTRMVNI